VRNQNRRGNQKKHARVTGKLKGDADSESMLISPLFALSSPTPPRSVHIFAYNNLRK
jgi:hypothetical protein